MTKPAAPRDPALAAILSFIVPGLGQLYCLRVGSFFAWLLPTIVAYVVFLPLGLILHVLAIVHAFQVSGKPLPPIASPTHTITKPASPTLQTKPVEDSKLFIAGLVLVGVLGVIAIVVLPSRDAPDMPSGIPPSPIRRSYPWLNQCGPECEQRLRTSRLAFIDDQTCETLAEMRGVTRTENQAAWNAVILDKATSLECVGF